MASIPDLVKLSKLDTQFHSDPDYTQHVVYMPRSNFDRGETESQRFERWEKTRRCLGNGSFGIVWLERCIQGDKKGELRAVKEFKKKKSGDYYGELHAVAFFSHPRFERYFVKSFGWYEDEDDVFLPMEYLSCGDLQSYLKSPLTEGEAQCIVAQIIEGLKFMHDNDFVHRDLKPQNILVAHKGPQWRIKIADFGISKRVADDMTALRTVTGTPIFAAPEISASQGHVSGHSYTNAVDICQLNQFAHGKINFPSNSLLNNNVSKLGCDFIERSMQLEPQDRPNVGECQQDLWLQSFQQIFPEAQRLEMPLRLQQDPPAPSEYQTSASLSIQNELPSAKWSTQSEIPSAGGSTRLETPSTRHSTQKQKLRNSASSAIELVSESAEADEFAIFPEFASTENPQSNDIEASSIEKSNPQNWYLERELKGHSKPVSAVAYSPVGNQIASGSKDRSIRLWDPATGALIKVLKGHSGLVNTIAYSPNGSQIISGSEDKTVRLWNLVTGAFKILKGHSSGVEAVAYSPNGSQIASGSYDQTIRLWDPVTGVIKMLESRSDAVRAIAYSPNGSQIVSGSDDEKIRLWNPVTGVFKILKGHSGPVLSVAYSPSGSQIASGSEDQTTRLWDPAKGAILHILRGFSEAVSTVAYSPSGNQVASGSWDTIIRIWDSATGALLRVLEGDQCSVWAVAYSPNGNQIASASYNKTIGLWGPNGEDEESRMHEKSRRRGKSRRNEKSGKDDTSGRDEKSPFRATKDDTK